MKLQARFAVIVGVAALCLVGCSGTMSVAYTAQNFARFRGETDIGKFTYEPSLPGAPSRASTTPLPSHPTGEAPDNAPLIKPNQIQNSKMGDLYVSGKIADLVKRATVLELERTGVVLSDASPIVLSGDVMYFKADDLGSSVDWTYAVRYRITRRSDSTVLLNKIYEADPTTTGKFGRASDYAPTVSEMILSAYDKFIRDGDVKKLLMQKADDPKAAKAPVPGA